MIFFDAYIKYLEHLKNRKYDPPVTTQATETIVITWDGNTEGKDIIPDIILGSEGTCYVKVSDKPVTHGCTISRIVMQQTISGDSVEMDVKLAHWIELADGISGLRMGYGEDFVSNPVLAIVFHNDITDEEAGITMGKGVYFTVSNIQVEGVSRNGMLILLETETVH